MDKFDELRRFLSRYGKLAVAFSGGVDSVCLLQEAAAALGTERVVAVTVAGANFPGWEGGDAEAFARELGVRRIVLEWDPFAVPGFVENSPERCYHCKKALLGIMLEAAEKWGADALVDGSNADDAEDYRPGSRAAAELGVVGPLRECGLGKAEIRARLREKGVRFWEKPSFACLASRVPYGVAVTADILSRIERAEEYLLRAGLATVRVRHHGEVARIEVGDMDRRAFEDASFRMRVADAFREFGYAHTALDLRGYKTGSMNVFS